MVRRFALAMALAATGCAGAPDFSSHLKTCGGPADGFAVVASCVRALVMADPQAAGRDGDLTALYLAYLSVVEERVASGAYTEAEGRLKLTQVTSQASEIAGEREVNRWMAFSAAMASMGNATQSYGPPPLAVPTTPPPSPSIRTYNFRGGSMTCYGDRFVNCF